MCRLISTIDPLGTVALCSRGGGVLKTRGSVWFPCRSCINGARALPPQRSSLHLSCNCIVLSLNQYLQQLLKLKGKNTFAESSPGGFLRTPGGRCGSQSTYRKWGGKVFEGADWWAVSARRSPTQPPPDCQLSLCKTFLIHCFSVSGNIQSLLVSTCTKCPLEYWRFSEAHLVYHTSTSVFNTKLFIDFHNGPTLLLSSCVCRFSGRLHVSKASKCQCLDIQ